MVDSIREFLQNLDMGPVALAFLLMASMIEYVFPPFPGDTVILGGAFLVGASGWNAYAVLAAVNLGSLVGIFVDYHFGRYVREQDRTWRARWRLWERTGRALDRLLPLFERHPNLYLVANRFLPSIRALFFVAAGMVRFPLWRVLVLGGVSSFGWCLLIFAVGYKLGQDWEALVAFFTSYQRAAWALVVVVAVLVTVRLLRRRSPES